MSVHHKVTSHSEDSVLISAFSPPALAVRTLATVSPSVKPIIKPPRFGQPHSSTHPHLLSDGELTIGITASEYEERRSRLMRRLPEGSRVICMGGTVRLMTQREFWGIQALI